MSDKHKSEEPSKSHSPSQEVLNSEPIPQPAHQDPDPETDPQQNIIEPGQPALKGEEGQQENIASQNSDRNLTEAQDQIMVEESQTQTSELGGADEEKKETQEQSLVVPEGPIGGLQEILPTSETEKLPESLVSEEVDIAQCKKNLFSVKLGGWLSVTIFQDDITNEKVDAITNAANESLMHGAGVAGAVMRRGGYEVQKLSDKWVDKYGQVETGTTAYTGPGKISQIKLIIHAVGPVWSSSKPQRTVMLLRSCIMNTLRRASALKLTSVSIPAISSGIFGFPKPLCAQVLFDTVERFVQDTADSESETLRVVRFTNFDTETTTIFQNEFIKRYIKKPAPQPEALKDGAGLAQTQSAPETTGDREERDKDDDEKPEEGEKKEKKKGFLATLFKK